MKLLIKNGRVIDPANKIDGKADVLIENGKIKKVGSSIKESGAEEIDASGKLVCPGFVDMHVHFREPGREDKETIESCTRAAARGGFTAVVGMPNTTPVADDQTVIGYVYRKLEKEGIVNGYAVGNITKKSDGGEIAQIKDLIDAGAIAVSDDGHSVMDAGVMKMVLDYLKIWDLPLISHAEDANIAGNWCMHEGRISTRLGLAGKSPAAEEVMIAREIVLSEASGSHVHFTHVNSKVALDMIRSAKARGARVSCDTCPHYFSLTDEAVLGYNPNAKMNPPLRSQSHVDAVKKALKDNTIDCITTDHAPHTLVEKYLEFELCANGIVGLETSIPLVMDRLVHREVITPTQMVEKMSLNPAKILKLNKGTLSEGADADITIIDPELEETIDKAKFESKGRNTPFDGLKLKGIPVTTIVGGKLVMQDRKVTV